MTKFDKTEPNFDHPDMSAEETLRRHGRVVEEGLAEKLRKMAGSLPFVEDLCAAWFCARDDKTPARVRGILLGALAYFVMPADMIPDIVVGFGFSDDATVMATAIALVGSHIKAPHYTQAKAFLRKDSDAGN